MRQKTTFDAQTQQRLISTPLQIANVDGSVDRELYACQFACGTPSWSPNGDRIAFYSSSDWAHIGSVASPPSGIYFINADGTGLTRLTQGMNHALRPRWSPDGVQIAFEDAQENQVQVINVETSAKTIFNLNDLKGGIHYIEWSPDQQQIAFSAIEPKQGKRQLYLLDLTDGTFSPLSVAITEAIADTAQPAWSSDGKKLVFIAYDSQIYVADLSVLKTP